MSSLISVHDLSYHQPDGTILFEHFTFNLQSQKIGIVGRNGIGKSTLLKLISNELKPHSGTIIVRGKVSYLPQKIQDFSKYTVAQILNVDAKLHALKKAEMGLANENDFNQIGDNWNLEAEISEIFTKLRIHYLNLERLGSSLSGGELMRVLLARIFLEKPDLILLDEPTNNLDTISKSQFYEALHVSKAGMLIVSHDRNLLNQMDSIMELSNLGLKIYGGNFDFYLAEREKENIAALNSLKSAEDIFDKQTKLEHEMRDKQSHKSAHGKARAIREGMSVLEVQSKIGSAQKTTARLKKIHEEKTFALQKNYEEAKGNLRDHFKIHIDLVDVSIPSKKEMIFCKNLNYRFPSSNQDLWTKDLDIEIRGNERVAITGANGSGKTTLINLIIGKLLPNKGEIRVGTSRIAVLDQLCSIIDDNQTVLENLKRFASLDMKEHEIRVRAGRFLFYGEDVFKNGAQLSGGERLRAALACLLAMDNAPQILILDEPTNNLDLDSIGILTDAINQYTGCLIVVSHDNTFLDEINLDRKIMLS